MNYHPIGQTQPSAGRFGQLVWSPFTIYLYILLVQLAAKWHSESFALINFIPCSDGCVFPTRNSFARTDLMRSVAKVSAGGKASIIDPSYVCVCATPEKGLLRSARPRPRRNDQLLIYITNPKCGRVGCLEYATRATQENIIGKVLRAPECDSFTQPILYFLRPIRWRFESRISRSTFATRREQLAFICSRAKRMRLWMKRHYFIEVWRVKHRLSPTLSYHPRILRIFIGTGKSRRITCDECVLTHLCPT